MEFRGQPVIMAMIYTRCQATCPLIVSEMQRIEKALSPRQRARVRFALFSFDSENETPQGLTAFAQAHGLDLSRWTLLYAPRKDVRELAAALSVRYKKAGADRYVHSNGVSVLDPQGVLRYQRTELGGGAEEPARVVTGLLGS